MSSYLDYPTYGISTPINIVELPTRMKKIISNFVYLNFHPTERTEIISDETELDGTTYTNIIKEVNNSGDKFPDRYVLIKILNEVDVTSDLTIIDKITECLSSVADKKLSQTSVDPEIAGNVFFTQDFIDGFIRISPDNLQNEILFQRKTNDMINASNNTNVAIKSVLDYLKMNLRGSDYVDLDLNEYEKTLKALGQSSTTGMNILDPNTNLPITTTDVSPASTAGDAYVSSYYVDKVFKRSKASPVIWNLTNRSVKLAELVSKESYENKNLRRFSNMFTLLGQQTDGLNLDLASSVNLPVGELSYRHVGWHALKYIKDGENYRYDSSFLLFANGQKEIHEIYPGASNDIVDATDEYHVFKDPYVLYGQTYRYEIRDAWALIRKESSSSEKVFILLGTQSINMETSCVENLPPPAPSNFSFDYVGDDTIRIGWTKELRLTENLQNFEDFTPDSESFFVDDTCGYLLFLRNSLEEPYHLVNQFHIRRKNIKQADGSLKLMDTNVNESIIGATVPNDQIVIISDATNQEHLLEIRSNQDYYIAFCAYDVHGNISNYSEQFFLRRNNVTGEVSTKLASARGASLAYPNALIPSTFILSSMKASGYKFMDVHQTPDLSTSYPTTADGVTIHLIDLETEEDQIVSSIEVPS